MPYNEDDSTYVPCWNMVDSDVWNFDGTLALFIADGFDRLAEIDHGYPAELDSVHGSRTWKHQLRHHANSFRDYAGGDRDAEPQDALIFLAYRFGHLWD